MFIPSHGRSPVLVYSEQHLYILMATSSEPGLRLACGGLAEAESSQVPGTFGLQGDLGLELRVRGGEGGLRGGQGQGEHRAEAGEDSHG